MGNDSINERKTESSEVRHHSSEHSHHRSHSHSGHRSSKSSTKRHRSSSSNIPEEYRKKKRTRLCWRILFIAACLGVMIWLITMIINVDDLNTWTLPKWMQPQQNTEQLTNELDALKTENMTLKYELEKYKNKYGELESSADSDSKKDNK